MWMVVVDGWCDPSCWDEGEGDGCGWGGRGVGGGWDIYRLFAVYWGVSIQYVCVLYCVLYWLLCLSWDRTSTINPHHTKDSNDHEPQITCLPNTLPSAYIIPYLSIPPTLSLVSQTPAASPTPSIPSHISLPPTYHPSPSASPALLKSTYPPTLAVTLCTCTCLCLCIGIMHHRDIIVY